SAIKRGLRRRRENVVGTNRSSPPPGEALGRLRPKITVQRGDGVGIEHDREYVARTESRRTFAQQAFTQGRETLLGRGIGRVVAFAQEREVHAIYIGIEHRLHQPVVGRELRQRRRVPATGFEIAGESRELRRRIGLFGGGKE